jgi:hypothetical protein
MSTLNLTSTHQKSIFQPIIVGIAATLILMVGLIHFVEAPDNYAEANYKGILFALNGLGAFVAAYGIYTRQNWGWWLGLLISGGAIVMYIVSRTLGLPDVGVDDAWFEPMGVLSILVEGAFVILFGWRWLNHS